jgi:hypothetical protein
MYEHSAACGFHRLPASVMLPRRPSSAASTRADRILHCATSTRRGGRQHREGGVQLGGWRASPEDAAPEGEGDEDEDAEMDEDMEDAAHFAACRSVRMCSIFMRGATRTMTDLIDRAERQRRRLIELKRDGWGINSGLNEHSEFPLKKSDRAHA